MSAQAEGVRGVTVLHEIIQEIFFPAPGPMPRAVDKEQRRGMNEGRGVARNEFDFHTVTSFSAIGSARRLSQRFSRERIGPVITVVISAMSTIITKTRAERIPRS